MNRAETITRSFLSRLGQEGLDAWADRIRNANDKAHRLSELEALRASLPRLSTKTTALLNQAVELLEVEDAHREQLLDATLWCMNEATFDAFRLRVQRFLDGDRVLLGTIEPPPDEDGRRFAVLRGNAAFARTVVTSPSARATLWFTEEYPPTFRADATREATARSADATVRVSVSEPGLPAYQERQAERARNDLVEAQGFKLISAGDDIVYWDEPMATVWHRVRSPLNPESCARGPMSLATLPARFQELELVLGARNEGDEEKRRSLVLLRQLDWAAWYEDPVTGDRWYEDVPSEAGRLGGPSRLRRAGSRRETDPLRARQASDIEHSVGTSGYQPDASTKRLIGEAIHSRIGAHDPGD